MEEPELRVGGWEKQGGRRLFKRLLSLILIVSLGTLILGPNVVEYRPAYVSSDSLYFPTTWNGPFDAEYSKEFNGHLKISSISYEASDSKSGKLTVISISSLIDLENLNMQSVVVDKVESQAKKEGLELKNGKIVDEEMNVNGLTVDNTAYQWDANVTENANFFLVVSLGTLILGPNVVEYRPAYVSSDSLYFPTTWNGPFDTEYSKEFNGHLKISSISYESSDSKSGKLTVISISSLIDLENLNIQSVVVDKVESQAKKEGLELKNGEIVDEEMNVNGLTVDNTAYQWDANVTENANFFLDNGIGSEILVKVYFWTIEKSPMSYNNGPDIEQLQSQTIICIAFGTNLKTIEQATEMIGNVKI